MGPPDRPGDDTLGTAFQELSDGLERLKPGEGADVAPDRAEASEDKKGIADAKEARRAA